MLLSEYANVLTSGREPSMLVSNHSSDKDTRLPMQGDWGRVIREAHWNVTL